VTQQAKRPVHTRIEQGPANPKRDIDPKAPFKFNIQLTRKPRPGAGAGLEISGSKVGKEGTRWGHHLNQAPQRSGVNRAGVNGAGVNQAGVNRAAPRVPKVPIHKALRAVENNRVVANIEAFSRELTLTLTRTLSITLMNP